jgi:hypothetical protein
MTKINKVAFDGKENSSLYSNIRSKSIRNIFKQEEPITKIKTSHNSKIQRCLEKEASQISNNEFLDDN